MEQNCLGLVSIILCSSKTKSMYKADKWRFFLDRFMYVQKAIVEKYVLLPHSKVLGNIASAIDRLRASPPYVCQRQLPLRVQPTL